ncbi:MAG: hypothetical protein OXH58_05855, partial [Acidimicrobiaceae bacterium]|nr:hypothetical protein [Acidimicrobiaceae bacterium]
KGGDATDQLNGGQNTWPPVGNSAGRHWAILLAVSGQIPLAVDRSNERIDGQPWIESRGGDLAIPGSLKFDGDVAGDAGRGQVVGVLRSPDH